jgi:hypothetical protein
VKSHGTAFASPFGDPVGFLVGKVVGVCENIRIPDESNLFPSQRPLVIPFILELLAKRELYFFTQRIILERSIHILVVSKEGSGGRGCLRTGDKTSM